MATKKALTAKKAAQEKKKAEAAKKAAAPKATTAKQVEAVTEEPQTNDMSPVEKKTPVISNPPSGAKIIQLQPSLEVLLNNEPIGIENLKLVLGLSFEVWSGIKKTANSGNWIALLEILDEIYLLKTYNDTGVLAEALKELKDLSVEESEEISLFLVERFPGISPKIDAQIEEVIFLIPETYATVQQVIKTGAKWAIVFNRDQKRIAA